MQCDMCGSEEKLYKAIIEGTTLTVCTKCAKFGKVIAESRVQTQEVLKRQEKTRIPKKETIQTIVEDFAVLIKTKREELGLKQKEMASKLAEKESVIQNVEAGNLVPSINLARKFERHLGLRLIEDAAEEEHSAYKSDSGSVTIGDIIQLKKKG